MQPNQPKPNKNLLVVIAGPTAVGKTSLSIRLAKKFRTEIIAADSRQFYREMKIGTAAPSEVELATVPHHFIGHLSVTEPYDVSRYETDALQLIDQLFEKYPILILTGGSGMYINAVCHGFDDLPDPDPNLRDILKAKFADEDISVLQKMLKKLDPVFYEQVDLKNPNRLLRAIEVCMITGKPYSQLRKGESKTRPFKVLKIALNLEREELFSRIALRTDQMMRDGFLEEARSLLPYRNTNALNALGYKELFEYMDGKCTLEQAVTDIITNTRRYAKRQLTWFKKDKEYHWFQPDQTEEIAALIASKFSE